MLAGGNPGIACELLETLEIFRLLRLNLDFMDPET